MLHSVAFRGARGQVTLQVVEYLALLLRVSLRDRAGTAFQARETGHFKRLPMRDRTPESHVVATARDEGGSVRRECHRRNRSVFREDFRFLCGVQIPQSNRPVIGGGSEDFAVGGERQRIDGARMPSEGLSPLARIDIPEDAGTEARSMWTIAGSYSRVPAQARVSRLTPTATSLRLQSQLRVVSITHLHFYAGIRWRTT